MDDFDFEQADDRLGRGVLGLQMIPMIIWITYSSASKINCVRCVVDAVQPTIPFAKPITLSY